MQQQQQQQHYQHYYHHNRHQHVTTIASHPLIPHVTRFLRSTLAVEPDDLAVIIGFVRQLAHAPPSAVTSLIHARAKALQQTGRSNHNLQSQYLQLMMHERVALPAALNEACRDFQRNSSAYSTDDMRTLFQTLGYFNHLPSQHCGLLTALDGELSRRFAHMDVVNAVEILQALAYLNLTTSASMIKYLTPAFLARVKGTTES